jgi:dihydroxyacetone kinase-like protein
MARTTIAATDLCEILRFTAEAVTEEETRLNALDAAIGDGDHGITVRVGFQAVKKSMENAAECTNISAILGNAGIAFMGATGGAIGIILGRMLICGQGACRGSETLGVDELKRWLEAMESTITAVGKAKPGDKTILDAVHAASVAVSPFISGPNDIVEALLAASQAAGRAASETANMLCKVGRASRLGDRVLGHPDPGAVTFSIVLNSFYRWSLEHPPGTRGDSAA